MNELIEQRLINEQLLQIRAFLLSIMVPSMSASEHLEVLRQDAIEFRARMQPKTAGLSLPDRCNGVPDERCGLKDDDARMSVGSLRNPDTWQCRGCRVRSDAPVA